MVLLPSRLLHSTPPSPVSSASPPCRLKLSPGVCQAVPLALPSILRFGVCGVEATEDFVASDMTVPQSILFSSHLPPPGQTNTHTGLIISGQRPADLYRFPVMVTGNVSELQKLLLYKTTYFGLICHTNLLFSKLFCETPRRASQQAFSQCPPNLFDFA